MNLCDKKSLNTAILFTNPSFGRKYGENKHVL